MSRRDRQTTVREQRMVIALDYGTTFTGMAYGFPSRDTTRPNDIRIVQDWGLSGLHDKVPSVISYSTPGDGEEQWSLSLSPDALTMVNTKLEVSESMSAGEYILMA
jgi:molecular chaperone DnaK (HSP70)